MTLMGKRFELKAALDAVPGIHGHEKRPPEPVDGDAWPAVPSLERAAGDAFLVTWAIRVVTPQDEYAAVDWWDEIWPLLYYGLKPVLSISSAAPIVIDTAAGQILAYNITGSAEE